MTSWTSFDFATIVISICGLLEWTISGAEKEKVRVLLLRGLVQLEDFSIKPALNRAATGVLTTLDTIYGPKYWSMRAFRTSALTSVAFVFLLGLLFSSQITAHYSGTRFRATVLASMILSAALCIPFDYLSMNKARFIMKLSKNFPLESKLLILMLDFAASYFLCIICVWIAIAASFILKVGPNPPVASLGMWILNLIRVPILYVYGSVDSLFLAPKQRPYPPYIGISFLSTLSTLFLFVVNVLITIGLIMISSLRNRLSVVLNYLFESKTLFISFGVICCGLISLVKWISHLIYWMT